jgi:hypothetical protein
MSGKKKLTIDSMKRDLKLKNRLLLNTILVDGEQKKLFCSFLNSYSALKIFIVESLLCLIQ